MASRWVIAFVRAGWFDVVLDGARRRLSEGSVFIQRPGLEFRCRHTDLCPTDVCISVAFGPDAVSGAEQAWERAGWSVRTSATPRLAYVDRRMAGAAAGEDRFELERWALAALTALASSRARASVASIIQFAGHLRGLLEHSFRQTLYGPFLPSAADWDRWEKAAAKHEKQQRGAS